MSEFYQAGDCFCALKTANEQRANKSMWREQLQRKMWCKRRDEIMKAINELWMNDGSYVNIWEEWWFPGIENFLDDLQQMGYHVYVGSADRHDNQGMTQRRYCVYLDELPNKKEWGRMPEVRPIDANALKKDLSEFNYDMALRIVDTQPTIEAKPVRHGQWIPTEYNSYFDGVPVWDKFECSECGHEHNGEEDTLTAFCPDCGARMDAIETNNGGKGGDDNDT